MKLPYYCLIILRLCLFSAKGETLSSNIRCGNIFTNNKFVLTSENYPLPYPPDKECFYLLKGGNCTTHFNIEFLDFNLANSVGCVKDRLEIGSQDALCGMRNGSRVYISEQGSLKLKFVSDKDPEKNNRGFRLLVTRVGGCEPINSTNEKDYFIPSRNDVEDTTETIPFEWTTKSTIFPTKAKPSYLPPKSPSCCQNAIYSSNKFMLVSPNFPFTLSMPRDCTYTIRKASPLVCRLRINILFFTLGLPGASSCPNGHLEIDGKYICGCNSDLQLTTNFGSSESKYLKFYSPDGYDSNDVSGFVLEVIQDECQKKYDAAAVGNEKFRYYKDQFNQVKWPSVNNNIDQLKLVKERNYYLPSKKSNEVDNQFGDVYQHVYFFAPEDEEDVSWTQNNQEKEETNYIDVSTINTLITNQFSYQQCRNWNANQLTLLQGRFGNSLQQVCQTSQQTSSSCSILRSFSGRFASPGYPIGYPLNKNFCYRFQMLPGYCAVQIFFNDFQIETSYDCLKDSLTINQYRYCGNYLSNKQVTINTRGKSHQDLNFVSDVNNVVKGFSAVYQQVRCQEVEGDSIRPISPSPAGEAADDDNLISCGNVIADKYFSIRSGYWTQDSCIYRIARSSMNVCKVRFYFECLRLPCEVGSISINDQIFCGERSGETVIMDIFDAPAIVVFRQYRRYNFTRNTGFSILGEQIIDSQCETFTPEPVRLISAVPQKGLPALSSSGATKYYGNPYQDICELIKQNITTRELPYKICQILHKHHNAIECNFSRAVLLDVPATNSTRIQLLNDNPEKIIYKEITCQNT